jgi:TPR repeat protein
MMRYAIILLFLIRLPVSASDFELGKQAFAKGDYAAALKEWQPLAEQGLPFAAYNVALLYAKGQGVPKDPAEAAKWYKIAADKGIPEAQYNLGVLYSTGSGVPRNYMQATQWFERAAAKGDANAENALGTMYDGGEASVGNFSEAEKWYRKSAEDGNSNAQFNLGVMYDIGHGVKVNFTEAEKWYRKAADQWNEGALCNLAILYYNGQGVKRDLIQAHTYYLLAKEAGDPRASNLMELTTEKLTSKQVAQAEQAAQQFKSTHAQQIARAKDPITKPPSPDSVGPAVAGAYTVPASSSPGLQPSVVAAAVPVSAVSALPGVWTGVERVVAIGDLHGDYRQFATLLRSAGVIDEAANWSGGRTHLVQTGDVVDEGADSRRIMDLLMKLEDQAKAAGGMVHCLIGNHEAMDVYGDLRFVSPAGYQAFATPDSVATRDRAYAIYQTDQQNYAAARKNLVAEVMPEDAWNLQHPPGFFEQRDAFGPTGKYGQWLMSHDTVIRINNALYSHAGISPKYAGLSISAINDAVRKELTNPGNMAGGIVTDMQGPLWYQRLADKTADPGLESVLKHFDVAREVVGHVDAGSAVTPRFGNRVILIDVGLSRGPDNTGRQACLIEEKNQLYALHRGVRIPLPKDETTDMLRYLKQAAALDPEPSPLTARIQVLETK